MRDYLTGAGLFELFIAVKYMSQQAGPNTVTGQSSSPLIPSSPHPTILAASILSADTVCVSVQVSTNKKADSRDVDSLMIQNFYHVSSKNKFSIMVNQNPAVSLW